MKLPTRMGTDQNGYIVNPTHLNKLQEHIKPILHTLLQLLLNRLGENVHSMYVYGSVARGEAIPFKSDLDLTVILYSPISSTTKNRIHAETSELLKEYKQLTKVDYDMGEVKEALHPDNYYEWGFWLKHMCCCIHGEDLSTQFPVMKPNKFISSSLNKDLMPQTNRFMDTLKSGTKTSALEKQSMIKKMIRGTYLTINVEDESWATTIQDQLNILEAYFPNDSIIQELQYVYKVETIDSSTFLSLLHAYKLWYEKRHTSFR
ncbi:nucleotidyltransferase domain-containing protein [Shouchella hunanensis]|uniref:Nucleotidyltransferase domain-containing protein n=1 Tax=Shouchella hunanensis TaxID=766894 RepID=A0ABY7WD60_9BACI|nr:nucleotidyltransferase domain-containing protein [Shouchella hunanensis]WDF05564.1 nucleotidyltransferase domain-containing protein [Shouchella hunanensis]